MPTEVILPRVDMDMTEGSIAAWRVSEGDEVREGTVIFEIETSKATMEVDAPASGIIRQISAPVGTTVPVGTAVAWIYAAGEAVQERPGAGGGGAAEEATQERAQPQTETETEARATNPGAAARNDDEPVRATPAARRLARERGLQLVSIAGSGPQGRIAAQDVLRMAYAGGASTNGAEAEATLAGEHDALHTVWLQRGSGDTLVLLHGFAAESNSWRPFAQALKRLTGERLSLLAIDLPAHGKSPDTAAGSLESMVAAVERTLLAEGIKQCHLVGHSFGGAIALATAASSTRVSVRSLALFAPAGLGPESNGAFLRGVTQASRRASLAPWLRQLFADPSKMDEGFVATAAQQLERADVRERLAAVADRFFPDGTQCLDLRDRLAALTMPVRIVWGLQDRILPARHADGVPGRIAVHRFAGVGHLPQVEAQDDVARLVLANMAGADTESRGGHAAIG